MLTRVSNKHHVEPFIYLEELTAANAGAPLTVGRSTTKCTIYLPQLRVIPCLVSTTHAELRLLPDGRLQVTDLRSTNGTFYSLPGDEDHLIRVWSDEPVQLPSGSTLYFGSKRYVTPPQPAEPGELLHNPFAFLYTARRTRGGAAHQQMPPPPLQPPQREGEQQKQHESMQQVSISVLLQWLLVLVPQRTRRIMLHALFVLIPVTCMHPHSLPQSEQGGIVSAVMHMPCCHKLPQHTRHQLISAWSTAGKHHTAQQQQQQQQQQLLNLLAAHTCSKQARCTLARRVQQCTLHLHQQRTINQPCQHSKAHARACQTHNVMLKRRLQHKQQQVLQQGIHCPMLLAAVLQRTQQQQCHQHFPVESALP